MKYYQLNEKSVIDYLKTVESIATLFSSVDNLDVKDVGDGNLNFVYIISNRDKPQETVVLKQAVPFLKVVGESWPLSRHRINSEVRALQFQASVCPDLVPKIYYSSYDMSLIIMENLNKHAIIRAEIIAGNSYPKLADHLSTFLANTLFYSSDLDLSSAKKKQQLIENINPELCKITEDFVFTHPYEDNESNDYPLHLNQAVIDTIQKDPQVRCHVNQMKWAFMNQSEALIHGDLHIGSVMANQDETYVIDPEFSFYGPMGFDIGALISNLYLAYFSQCYHQSLRKDDAPNQRQWLLECIETLWTQFEAKFLHLWQTEDAAHSQHFMGKDLDGSNHQEFRAYFMQRLLSDSLGFAACKMMRRIVGLAKVADIADIPDPKARTLAETQALTMATKLLVQRHQYTTIHAVSALAQSISPLINIF